MMFCQLVKTQEGVWQVHHTSISSSSWLLQQATASLGASHPQPNQFLFLVLAERDWSGLNV